MYIYIYIHINIYIKALTGMKQIKFLFIRIKRL